MDDDFRELEDFTVGADAPPILQQITDQAIERVGADDAERLQEAIRGAIAERIEHHGWRLEQVTEQRDVQRRALQRSAERLEFRLNTVRGQLELLDTEIARDTEHDRLVLDELGAYLFERSRRKSLHFGHMRLGTKTKTTKDQPECLDKDRLAVLLPEFTAPALQWGEAKKALSIVEGTVYGPDGEALPEDVVTVRKGTSETTAFAELPGKVRIQLREGYRTDGDDGAGETTGADDPFGDDSDYAAPGVSGAFD